MEKEQGVRTFLWKEHDEEDNYVTVQVPEVRHTDNPARTYSRNKEPEVEGAHLMNRQDRTSGMGCAVS